MNAISLKDKLGPKSLIWLSFLKKNQPAQKKSEHQANGEHTPNLQVHTELLPANSTIALLPLTFTKCSFLVLFLGVPHSKIFKAIYKETGTTYMKKSQIEKAKAQKRKFSQHCLKGFIL